MMHVIKRSGDREPVNLNKITDRIRKIADHQNVTDAVDPVKVAQKVCSSLFDGVTTRELDELSAEIAVAMTTEHPGYGKLAAGLVTSNLHKSCTLASFSAGMELLYQDAQIADEVIAVVRAHRAVLDERVRYERDYRYDYFGLKTLLRSYLLKVEHKAVRGEDGLYATPVLKADRLAYMERPQDMLMRVAIGIHLDDLPRVLETYDRMSALEFTHATPTLFNAGTRFPQLSSCFLVDLQSDSITGIYDTLSDCAQISKWAGGLGLSLHKQRGSGASIRNVPDACTGIVPSLRVFNATARWINQSGKRPGSIAVYLSVDHPDVMRFIDLRKNHGTEEERCRDLFTGLWLNDLFMERVQSNGVWSLFCPSDVETKLHDVFGKRYRELYEAYEARGLYRAQVPAQTLWTAICNAQIETGTPYLLHKDAVNRKSNQANVGVIQSSNLCTEIVEYTSPDEIAVCNLASLALPRFVDPATRTVDYDGLHALTKVVTRNLDRVIDRTFYPVDKARRSNLRHRPIGLGVQGLADVFMMLKVPFDSAEAARVNSRLFETIYHAAVETSCDLAEELGRPYDTFEGSPLSRGQFQFDLWALEDPEQLPPATNYDWESLRRRVRASGVRNSLLVAPMPTASTSQILGNNECFEPMMSNIFTRRTLAGEFVVVNKHLIADLQAMNLWDATMKHKIVAQDGSVQAIPEIPADLKAVYKTAFELSQKCLIDLAADRGRFICQSQSLNLFLAQPTVKQLSSMHFYAWKRGLKTGCYYLRTKPAANAVRVTVPTCLTCSS